MFVDYYAILQISSIASVDEIKAAFKNQALKWHPDKNPGLDTTFRMQQINEAYLILKDPDAREKYNSEYLKFKAYQKQKESKTEYKEHRKEEKYSNTKDNDGNQYEYSDYKVQDETLYNWMNNAKKQAVNLAKQTIEEIRELSKVGLVEGGKAMVKQIIGFLLAGLLITIGIYVFRGCNQVKYSERIEQTFQFSSADYIGIKKNVGSNFTKATGQIQFQKETITLDVNNEGNTSKDYCKIESVKHKKNTNEFNYTTNAGYFDVIIENNLITKVTFTTNDYLVFFKK